MLYLQILLAVISGAVFLEGVLSCLDGALPTSEWNDENRIGAFRTDADGDPVLVTIMEDFVFTCSGTIRQWRLQWSHRNTRPGCTVHFHFYVLRINTDPIQQFGPNTLSVQINISNVHVESILDVPSNRRIQVQANDFINIIVELNQGCGSSQFYILSKQYIKNTVYYKHFTSLSDGQQQAQLRYSTPQKPRYRSSRSYSKRYTNTKFEEERYIVPYVTAIMEEGDLIEDTSTATPHLTTKSPSSTISINQTASIPGANLTILKSTILVNQTASIPGGNLTNLKSTILVNQTTNIITPVLTSTNTVRGSRALGNIYILIGVGIAILLMLGITITALVLCTWQCKKIKAVQKSLVQQQHTQRPMHTALFTQPQLDIIPIYMYTPNETLESSMSAPSNEEIYSNPRTVGLYDPSLSGPQKYQMKQNKAYLKHPQKTPVVSEEVPPDDHFYEVDDY